MGRIDQRIAVVLVVALALLVGALWWMLGERTPVPGGGHASGPEPTPILAAHVESGTATADPPATPSISASTKTDSPMPTSLAPALDAFVIEGRVLAEADNTPVVGASVGLLDKNALTRGRMTGLTATTDANGAYKLFVDRNAVDSVLHDGKLLVAARHKGWLMARVHKLGIVGPACVAVAPDAFGNRQITPILMSRGVTISGRVRWADGRGHVLGTILAIQDYRLAAAEQRLEVDGHFELCVPPRAETTLFADVEGYGLANSDEIKVLDEPLRDIEIVLGPMASVAGRVEDQDGNLLAGASIKMVNVGEFELDGPEKPELVEVARSGADGRFTISQLVPGTYIVRAYLAGYGVGRREDKIKAHIEPGEAINDAVIVLTRAPHFAAGRVVNSNGKPVADVQVRCNADGEGPHPTTRTAADGTFRIDDVVAMPHRNLALGEFGANAKWFHDDDVILDDPSAEYVYDAGTATIVVSVVDLATGEPVRGLAVSAHHGQPPVIEDADLGIFRLDRVEVPFPNSLYRVAAQGYPEMLVHAFDLELPRTIAAGEVLHRTLRMSRAGSIVGRVVDALTGDPLPDRLVIIGQGANNQSLFPHESDLSLTTRTDAQGRFAFAEVLPGVRSIGVKAVPPHVDTAVSVRVLSGIENDAGDIAVDTGFTQRIRLVRGDKVPQPSVTVELKDDSGNAIQTATTSADGVAEFTGLGRARRRYFLQGLNTMLLVDGHGLETPEFSLSMGDAILEVVVQIDGKPADALQYAQLMRRPVSGAWLYAWLSPPKGQHTTDILRSDQMPTGQWQLDVSYVIEEKTFEEQRAVQLKHGELTRVVFTPDALGHVEGTVLAADGTPVANASVSLELEETLFEKRNQHAQTGKDGTFEIDGMPLGTHSLLVRHEDHGVISRTGIVVTPDTPPLTLMFEEKAKGRLESIARDDAAGAPLSEANTTVFAPGNPTYIHSKSHRGAAGQASISDIAVGDYDVEVSAEGYSIARHRVTITADETSQIESTLHPAGSFRWLLVDASGAPIVGAAVALKAVGQDGAAVHSGTTNRLGEWEAKGVRPGTYTATAQHNGRSAAIETTITAGRESFALTTLE